MKEFIKLHEKLTKQHESLNKKQAKSWAEFFKDDPKLFKKFIKYGMFKSIHCGSKAHEQLKHLPNTFKNHMLDDNHVILQWSDFYEDLNNTGLVIPKSHIGGYLSGSAQVIHANDPT